MTGNDFPCQLLTANLLFPMFVGMRGAKKGKKITIRLDDQMWSDLMLIADAAKRNLTDYIRVKLEGIIEDEKKVNKPKK